VSAELERRYARLLRLYPAGYRQGGEVLDTLMESTDDGRTRPPLREVAGLIVGALRAHAGPDVRDGWLAAFRAAALMLLVYDLADCAVRLVFELAYGAPFVWSRSDVVLIILALVLGGGAVWAGATGRYLSAIVAAGTAFAVSLVVAGPMQGPMYDNFWQFPLAIVLFVPLLLLRRRPPAATGLLRYVPVLPLLMVAVDQGLAPAFPAVTGILQRAALAALWLVALLWLAIDERVAMAVGLLLLNNLLIMLAFVVTGSIHDPVAAVVSLTVVAVGPAALLLSSAVTARRRARL
jgi:hypothetical protein